VGSARQSGFGSAAAHGKLRRRVWETERGPAHSTDFGREGEQDSQVSTLRWARSSASAGSPGQLRLTRLRASARQCEGWQARLTSVRSGLQRLQGITSDSSRTAQSRCSRTSRRPRSSRGHRDPHCEVRLRHRGSLASAGCTSRHHLRDGIARKSHARKSCAPWSVAGRSVRDEPDEPLEANGLVGNLPRLDLTLDLGPVGPRGSFAARGEASCSQLTSGRVTA
jgi:hypothetical protein